MPEEKRLSKSLKNLSERWGHPLKGHITAGPGQASNREFLLPCWMAKSLFQKNHLLTEYHEYQM